MQEDRQSYDVIYIKRLVTYSYLMLHWCKSRFARSSRVVLPADLSVKVAKHCSFELIQLNDPFISRWLIVKNILTDPQACVLWTAKHNDHALVKLILDHYDIKDRTKQLMAQFSENADIIDMLDVHVYPDHDRLCRLMNHPQLHNMSLINAILNKTPSSHNDKLATALFFASYWGHLELVRKLLHRGVLPDNAYEYHPAKFDVNIACLLIKYGASPKTFVQYFQRACMEGDRPFVSFVLERYSTERWPIEEGFLSASSAGHLDVVRVLKQRATPSTIQEGRLLAAAHGRMDVYTDLFSDNIISDT